MFIEQSSYHPKNNKIQIRQNIINKDIENQKEKKIEGESFNFLKWVKGLVNPLQNLPIISGIYSSINSNEKDSDRDLVQNSLGGFLYGGPIGAIAGLGNWVFNKVFEKTPTELFFKVTGISKLWIDESENSQKIIVQSENLNRLENIQNTSVEKNFVKLENQNLGVSDEKNNNTSSKIGISNAIKDEIKSLDIDSKKGIEFLYPKWKPKDEIEIKKNPKSLNLGMINKLYKNVDSEINGKLNTKA